LIGSDSGSIAPTPGTYVWEVPGKPVRICLSLDVVDRLLPDVMRGFGAVPKRGAEVGGILLGKAQRSDGGRLEVTIDDYELIPIEYKRGPSYLLSEEDRHCFAEAAERLHPSDDESRRPVGYFRSNTRDGAGLSLEDLDLISQFLDGPDTVVLYIRPFGTKVSQAGFYFQENGEFPEGPPLLEFPFRRRDLDPESAEADASPGEPEGAGRALSPPTQHRASASPQPTDWLTQSAAEAPSFGGLSDPAKRSRVKAGWIWAPLSFIFLLLGVLLGFQAALALRQSPFTDAKAFSLALTATRVVNQKGEASLDLKWDRQSPAIRAAKRGLLFIEDGQYSKPLQLSASDLQNGSVVYRYFSNAVKFRLEVYPNDRDSLAETVEWKSAQ
jgi:hypothetical protein